MRERRTATLELWARGNFTHESTDGTAQKNAHAIGEVSLLDELLDVIDGYAALEQGVPSNTEGE